MNPSPFPQPSSSTCPNCGAAVEGRPTLCPNCGAAMQVASSPSGGCVTLAVQVCLGLLAVVIGLCGACFVVFGVSSGGDSEFGDSAWILIGIGVGILALGGLCIWGIFKINKR